MADAKRPGSPTGEPDYLAVGFLRRPHGTRGEILMDLHTDFPERLKPGRKLFLGEARAPVTLAGVRPHGESVLVRLKGIDTLESAGMLRNTWVFTRTADVPALPEGKYYEHQLLGLRVEDEAGNLLGTLTEILKTGANDVYVVTDEAGGELLLPVIPDVIRDMQPAQGFIRVRVPEGL
ncbi:MAG: ribosome maturation factor RimM [Bacteroidota bacterium]